MKLKAIVASFAMVLFLSACGSAPVQTLDALIIKNNTNDAVHNVILRVPETHGIVSCGAILPGASCSLGFSERKNENHPAVLSWTHNNHEYTKPLIRTEPSAVHPGEPHQAVVIILEKGELVVYLD